MSGIFVEDVSVATISTGSTCTILYRKRNSDITLAETDVPELLSFLDSARAARTGGAKGRRTNLAIRRFLQALEREANADAFVDAWIALEALFGDKSGELH